jgi:hypothetical protein
MDTHKPRIGASEANDYVDNAVIVVATLASDTVRRAGPYALVLCLRFSQRIGLGFVCMVHAHGGSR